MSTQQLPLAAFQKVKQFIQSGLVIPESENMPRFRTMAESEDLPEPGSLDALGDLFKFASLPEEATHAPNLEGRWFVSVVNPGALLKRLPGLSLKPGWRLVSYLYRTKTMGTGVTWAVPESQSATAELEKILPNSSDYNHPPIPANALKDFMEAIDGDRSLRSFAIASMLYREVREFPALGSHQDWTHHRLIDRVPDRVQWQWQAEIPKSFIPRARPFPDGRAAIEFFSCRIVAPITIFRHIDLYLPGTYRVTGVSQAIATLSV